MMGDGGTGTLYGQSTNTATPAHKCWSDGSLKTRDFHQSMKANSSAGYRPECKQGGGWHRFRAILGGLTKGRRACGVLRDGLSSICFVFFAF